jgi:hypothetical protein
MTDEPKGQEYYNDAGTMLDRNLGATSAVAGEPGLMGLVYQWGRKDPFISHLNSPDGTVDIKSTYLWSHPPVWPGNPMEYAISHPTVQLPDRAYGDWMISQSIEDVDNTRWQSDKTIYDPCPAGWRVPDGGDDSLWKKADRDNNSPSGYDFSTVFGDESILYPHNGYLYNAQGEVYFWTIKSNPRKNESVSISIFDVWGGPGYFYYNYEGYCDRYAQCYIRCQKE